MRREVSVYLNEYNSLKNRIDLMEDGMDKFKLIEDFLRMREHLMCFDELDFDSNYFFDLTNFDYCYNKEVDEFISYYFDNFNLINDYNNKLFNVFKESRFNSCLFSDVSLINDFIKTNSVFKKSFDLVKDRISLGSHNYSYNGHTVSFHDEIAPCVFINDSGNSLVNDFILSHELGHVYESMISNSDKLSLNTSFMSELFSVLFESMFIDFCSCNSERMNYLKCFAYSNFQKMNNSMKLVDFFKDRNLEVKRNGMIILPEDASRFYMEGFSNPNIYKYSYLIGMGVGISLVKYFNDYDKCIKEASNLYIKGDINDCINVFNDKDVKEFIKIR